MKKIFTILLALIIIFSLCACSSPSPYNETTVADMAGAWKSGEVDGLEAVIAELGSSGDESIAEMLPYAELDSFILVMKLSLNSNGSFLMTADENTLHAGCDNLEQRLEAGVSRYLDAVILETIAQSGYTETQYMERLGISDGDDLKTALGIDPKAVLAELELNLLYERIEKRMSIDGTFEVKDNVLTLFTDEGKTLCQIDDGANSFTITGDDAPEALPSPMTFTRTES